MSYRQTGLSYCGRPHRTLLAAFRQTFMYTSAGQVEDIISKAHSEGKRIRVVGNALSPNGIGLSEDTMLSLGQCDRVLHVNKRARTVTVEVRVTTVVAVLILTYCGHLRCKARGEGVLDIMHGRSRMTIDPRVLTIRDGASRGFTDRIDIACTKREAPRMSYILLGGWNMGFGPARDRPLNVGSSYLTVFTSGYKLRQGFTCVQCFCRSGTPRLRSSCAINASASPRH